MVIISFLVEYGEGGAKVCAVGFEGQTDSSGVEREIEVRQSERD